MLVKDDTLTVSAEREKTEEAKDEGFYRFERRYGTFARAVGLPQGVDPDQISVSYENGVLHVRVPKPEEQKPRTIVLSKMIEGAGKTSSARSSFVGAGPSGPYEFGRGRVGAWRRSPRR